MSYYTYAVGTKKNNFVFLLAEIKGKRTWTKNPDNAMIFFTAEEVQHVIKMFKIPNCGVAKIRHKT